MFYSSQFLLTYQIRSLQQMKLDELQITTWQAPWPGITL